MAKLTISLSTMVRLALASVRSNDLRLAVRAAVIGSTSSLGRAVPSAPFLRSDWVYGKRPFGVAANHGVCTFAP